MKTHSLRGSVSNPDTAGLAIANKSNAKVKKC